MTGDADPRAPVLRQRWSGRRASGPFGTLEERTPMKRLFLLALAMTLAVGASAQTGKAPAKAPAKAAAKAPAAKPAATSNVKDTAMQQIDQFIASEKINKSAPSWKTSLHKPPQATFEKTHTYWAHLTTNKGPITIKFLPAVAPMHVTNFIYLAKLGFYDGTKFHRVITGFMAQGGDPLGNGTGGPGYGFDGEFSPSVKHDKPGMLSMANAGPGTDGSQFFLTFVPTPWLDGKHTIFGEITQGMDTMKKLEAAGSQSGRTTEPLTLEKVTIEVK
jgi:peptidyl-prolyl cis-trans isomerase B (cyclophilin B)